MGRTIPSFRLAQMYEEREWRPFRNALARSERKQFDKIFATSRLYISACSYATKPVLIQPILMSIILHHYKQLLDVSKILSEVAVDEPVSR